MKESLLIFGIPCFLFLGIFIYVQNNRKHVLATIFKGLASICFFLLPIVGLIIIGNKQSIKFDLSSTICLFIGLGFGVGGDILLNLRDLFKNPIKNYISLGGVISFFIGHVFYLIHLFMIVASKAYINKSMIFVPILIALVIIAVIFMLINKYIDKPKPMKIIAVVYVTIISLLVTVSCFNAICSLSGYEPHSTYFLVMFIGSLAFASSDVILIFNSFGKHPRAWVSAINLVLYYAGQLLIASSIILFYI